MLLVAGCGLSPYPEPVSEQPSPPALDVPAVGPTAELERGASFLVHVLPAGELAGCDTFWSGEDLYLWGPGCTFQRFAAGAWHPASVTDAPHLATWYAGTVDRSFILYGYDGPTHQAALYDPESDAWTSTEYMAMGQAPVAVTPLSAGASFLLWGGYDHHPNDSELLVEPRYVRFYGDEAKWRAMAPSGQPSPRFDHSAVFDSHHMFVFGGRDYAGSLLNDGGIYDLGSDAWERVEAEGAPSPRAAAATAWTGYLYVVFGGTEDGEHFLGDGGIYCPEPCWAWQPMSPPDDFAPRHPQAFFTGEHVEILQTRDAPLAIARYFPDHDRWEAVELPEALRDFVVLDVHWDWAEHRALLWGQREGAHALWSYYPPFVIDPSEGHPGDNRAGNQTHSDP